MEMSGPLQLYNGGYLVNEKGATFTLTADVPLSNYAANLFTNRGLFVKTGGTGAAAVSASFTNDASEGAATVRASAGTLRFSGPVTLAGGTYDALAGATLAFSTGNLSATGRMVGAPSGTVVFENGNFYADGAEAVLAFTGTGLRWLDGSFARRGEGTWVNAERLVVAGASQKYVQGATLVNRKRVEMGGPLQLYNGGYLVNDTTGTFQVADGATISNYAANLFTNRGLFEKTGTGSATVSASFTNTSRGTIGGEGVLQFSRLVRNDGAVAPGLSPGLLTWTGAFGMDSTSAALDVEIGGAAAGTGYDRLHATGAARLDGVLRVRLTGGYKPAEGAAFHVLTASSIEGGFTATEGMVDAGAGIALYPAIGDTAVTLTARRGILTASGALEATPASTVNGTVVTVLLTGTGFAPDARVFLACDDCSDPDAFATVPGRVQAMTPATARVQFDLRDPFVAGLYRLVLEDPRGGRVETPFAIGAGAGNLAVRVVGEGGAASEDGPVPGSIVIQLSAPQATPTTVAFTLGGTAGRFNDYVTSTPGLSLTIPAGRREGVLTILPLPDGVADGGETVVVTLDASTAYTVAGQNTFTVTIADGPAPTTFALSGATPDRAGNNGTLVMTISGQMISPTATARLAGGGGSYDATFVAVNDGGTVLRALFDLTGVAAGAVLDLTVTSGGRSITRAGAITVGAAVPPEISVQLVGPSTFRSFLPPQRYVALVTNRGNVDAVAVPVFLSVRKSGNPYIAPDFDVMYLDPTELDSLPPNFPGWDGVPLVEEVDDRLVMMVVVPIVQAGETVSLPFMARSYNIKVWTTPTSQPFVRDPAPVLRRVGAVRARKGGLENAWSGLSMQQIGVAAQAAVDPNQLSDCLTSLAGLLTSAIPAANCLQNVSKLGVAAFGNVAKAGLAAQSGNGKRAVMAGGSILVPLIGTAIACAKDALKANPWGLAFGVGLGLYSTYKDCSPLFDDPPGDGDDVDEVRASDPNDKLGPKGEGLARYTAGIDAAGYQIRFENDSAATAPAVLITVTDPLDKSVYDLSTFALSTIAFADTSVTPPSGLKNWTTTVALPGESRFVVRVIAGLNVETGVASWQLMAIDPNTGQFPADATAGFLPPNRQKPEGEGSLFFTIKPKAGLASGTQLCNGARIVFDVNEPIDTPLWCNTLDFVDPQSQTARLDPVQTDTSFTVSWTGQDATSGVSAYSVYVSTNDGPFQLWTTTRALSATFTGAQDSLYSFYTIARDGAGNLEDKEAVAEASTRVDATGVAVVGTDVPLDFALGANAPNPFGQQTRLRFALPEPARVRLEVFDALGRRVALLVDDSRAPGYYDVEWQPDGGLSSGLYFIRMNAGGFIEVREVTLVR